MMGWYWTNPSSGDRIIIEPIILSIQARVAGVKMEGRLSPLISKHRKPAIALAEATSRS
jgi:hypothetical protein